jgi:hypothetical protein
MTAMFRRYPDTLHLGSVLMNASFCRAPFALYLGSVAFKNAETGLRALIIGAHHATVLKASHLHLEVVAMLVQVGKPHQSQAALLPFLPPHIS